MADLKVMANELVESLFVNGGGDVAERLVLTDAAKRDLGGWCRGAIRDRVLALLSSVDAEATERAAVTVETMWRSAPNSRNDGYRQNEIGPGCVASIQAIRSTLPTPAATGKAKDTETR